MRCAREAFLGNATTVVNLDTRYLNAERRMKKWQRKEGARGKATRIPGVLGGKETIQAKAGTRKEVTAGQVESRRERVAIVKVEREAKAARACTGLILYQKMSMVVLRLHPPCSILKQVSCQDRQDCP